MLSDDFGWVQRQVHPVDRRIKNIFITPAGIKLIKLGQKKRCSVEKKFFKNPSALDKKRF